MQQKMKLFLPLLFIILFISTSHSQIKYGNTNIKDFETDAPWRVVSDTTKIPFLFTINDIVWADPFWISSVKISVYDRQTNTYAEIYSANVSQLAYSSHWEKIVRLSISEILLANPGLSIAMNDTSTFRMELSFVDNLPEKFIKYVRIFYAGEKFPEFTNWYAGDTHYHSEFTDNIYEFGGSIRFTSLATAAMGLDWITITDHSCDFTPIGQEFTPLRDSIIVNQANSSCLMIRGEEVTLDNDEITDPSRAQDILHFLIYDNDFVRGPDNTPLGITPSWWLPDYVRDKSTTLTSLSSALGNINAGFGYAAHPWYYNERISAIGAMAHWSDSNFSIASNQWIKFRGVEFWNTRINYNDVDVVDNNINPFPFSSTGIDLKKSYKDTLKRDETYWNGLLTKCLTPLRKIFVLGGSDAHGDFNYQTYTHPEVSLNPFNIYACDNAVAKVRTIAYCPTGLTQTNVLNALKNGNTVVTDGPIAVFNIDLNGDNVVDAIIGDDKTCDSINIANGNAKINIQWKNTSEFGGNLSRFVLYLTTSTQTSELVLDGLVSTPTISGSAQISLKSLAETYGVTYPVDQYFLLRMAVYTGDSLYRCYTNPIWLKINKPVNLANGLVAYYPFNGTAEDASGNGNHGTNYGATSTPDRFGTADRAYWFSNDLILIPYSSSNRIENDISVAVWIKFTVSENPTIIDKYYGGNDHGWIMGAGDAVHGSYGKVTFDGRDGRNAYLQSGFTPMINDNKWHFLVGQRAGNVWKIYLDGELSSYSDAGGTAGSIESGSFITIGASNTNGVSNYWPGALDDIRIYNRALSQTEIDSLYHEGGLWPYVRVTAPNGGENWPAGAVKQLTWNSWGVDSVRIEYSSNNGAGWNTVSPGYPAGSGYYNWNIPSINSDLCKVRVINTANNAIIDESNSTFSIVSNAIAVNISAFIEGFYNSATNSMVPDTLKVFLASASSPYTIIDTSVTLLNANGNATAVFKNAENGTYYLVLKHRNSIETWSKAGGEALAKGSIGDYDFTISANKAYGDNLIQQGSKWCIYSGDLNQDGIVDYSDLALIDNDSYSYVTGYVLTDVTGDNFVDYSDLAKVDNNSYSYIQVKKPEPTGQPCPGLPTISYSGKTYHTVQIGTQCWLKENLDIGVKISGNQDQSNDGTIEKYCYDDILSNCTTYGGLYQWDEAMQYVTDSSAQGICPTGWHLPTKTEMQTLLSAVNNNGNALKSVGQGTGSGQGTNTSGFSALLGGIRHLTRVFMLLNTNVFFHSSTADGGIYDFAVQLFSADSNITLEPSHRINGFPIRCLKN